MFRGVKKPGISALALLLILSLVLPFAPAVDAAQKSVRSGNQIATTPGSADTLAAGGAKINDHGHEFDEGYLTNKTGGSTADGDVYAVDTSNDSAFVAGDTQGGLQQFVVAVEVISNNAAGKTARSGRVTAKSTGTINRGEYVRKSATAKAVESTGIALATSTAPPVGAIGYAESAASGGFVLIRLYPATVRTGILDRVVATQTNTASNAENTLYTYNVKGGILGSTRSLRLTFAGNIDNTTTVGSTVEIKVKFGGTTFFGTGTGTTITDNTAAPRHAIKWTAILTANNATNAQTGSAEGAYWLNGASSTSGGGVLASTRGGGSYGLTIDSTAAQDLIITVQHGTNSASLTTRITSILLELL